MRPPCVLAPLGPAAPASRHTRSFPNGLPALLGARIGGGASKFLTLFAPVEHWRRAPLFLQAYVALNVTASLVLAVLRSPVSLVGVPIALLFAYFLLRRNRIAWFLVIAAQVIAAPSYIADHDSWLYLVWIGVDLILLLAPETRQFFSRATAEATEG